MFLASGVLHDVPANGGDFLHARADYPLIVLFAPFGAVMLTTEAVGMDLSRRPEWVRASTNLSLLAAGFGVRR